jgi:hypothetical protein
LAQIELGVKRVSLCVRSIVQLHEPAEIDGTRVQYSTQAAPLSVKAECGPEKRSAADILRSAKKKRYPKT